MIGYVLEQALSNAMPDRDVVTLLTRVRVDEHDLAFLRPNKPVGPVYPDREAALVAAHGSAVGRDGDGWRRMLASPQPLEVIPLHSISTLVDAGAIVICAGGGGIPVTRDERGSARCGRASSTRTRLRRCSRFSSAPMSSSCAPINPASSTTSVNPAPRSSRSTSPEQLAPRAVCSREHGPEGRRRGPIRCRDRRPRRNRRARRRRRAGIGNDGHAGACPTRRAR